MPCKLALIDFDGTLVDSMPFWADLPRSALRQRGIPIPADMDGLIRAMPMWQLAGVLVGRYPELGEEAALYAQFMDTMRQNYAERIPVKPGARAFLARMQRKGLPVTLLTATNHGLLDPSLDSYGFTPLLHSVVTDGDVGASKRTGAPFAYCVERFDLAPEELLLLEDCLANLQPALAQGLRCVGIADATMVEDAVAIRECTELFIEREADWEKIDILCGL